MSKIQKYFRSHVQRLPAKICWIIVILAILSVSLAVFFWNKSATDEDRQVDKMIQELQRLSAGVSDQHREDYALAALLAQDIVPDPAVSVSTDAGQLAAGSSSYQDLNVDGFAKDLGTDLEKATSTSFPDIMKQSFDTLDRYFLTPSNDLQLPAKGAAPEQPAPSPSLPANEVLYHPNGQVLSWAMFYKFLAEKNVAALPPSSCTSVKICPTEEWFSPYERWFRATYPQLPLYLPADRADPEIVRQLYGGLPPGVYSLTPEMISGAEPLGNLLRPAADVSPQENGRYPSLPLTLDEQPDAYFQRVVTPKLFAKDQVDISKVTEYVQPVQATTEKPVAVGLDPVTVEEILSSVNSQLGSFAKFLLDLKYDYDFLSVEQDLQGNAALQADLDALTAPQQGSVSEALPADIANSEFINAAQTELVSPSLADSVESLTGLFQGIEAPVTQ